MCYGCLPATCAATSIVTKANASISKHRGRHVLPAVPVQGRHLTPHSTAVHTSPAHGSWALAHAYAHAHAPCPCQRSVHVPNPCAQCETVGSAPRVVPSLVRWRRDRASRRPERVLSACGCRTTPSTSLPRRTSSTSHRSKGQTVTPQHPHHAIQYAKRDSPPKENDGDTLT